MSERTPDDAVPREILSALADGQASADEASLASSAWRQQPQARATWHAYHLIGEVMRSPDLREASDSAAFLQRMRDRLAEEPVVLSPQAAIAVGQSAAVSPQGTRPQPSLQPLKRRMWAGPAAVAASFAAIVGLLTSNLGGPAGQAESQQMARSGVGWSEGVQESSGMASALAAGGSFSAVRAQSHPWQQLDPVLERAMVVQRPQPSAPVSFSEGPEFMRAGGRAQP